MWHVKHDTIFIFLHDYSLLRLLPHLELKVMSNYFDKIDHLLYADVGVWRIGNLRCLYRIKGYFSSFYYEFLISFVCF